MPVRFKMEEREVEEDADILGHFYSIRIRLKSQFSRITWGHHVELLPFLTANACVGL
jgi:hypothetical protein